MNNQVRLLFFSSKAPAELTFSNVTHSSFVVEFSLNATSGADYFTAETRDGKSSCTVESGGDASHCLLEELAPATRYIVKARACVRSAITPDCSDEVTAIQWTVPLCK